MKKNIIVLFLLLCTNLISAQTNEYYNWVELDIEKKIIKKVKLSFTTENRFYEFSSFDEYYFQIGLTYKPFDFCSFGGYYRYSVEKNKYEEFETENRLVFDTKLMAKVNRWKPTFRIRFINYLENNELIEDKTSYLRYKPAIKFDIPNSKFAPFVSAEIFHHLTDNEINKVRYSAGLDYNFSKNIGCGAAWIYQDNLLKDTNFNILSLQFSFSF